MKPLNFLSGEKIEASYGSGRRGDFLAENRARFLLVRGSLPARPIFFCSGHRLAGLYPRDPIGAVASSFAPDRAGASGASVSIEVNRPN